MRFYLFNFFKIFFIKWVVILFKKNKRNWFWCSKIVSKNIRIFKWKFIQLLNNEISQRQNLEKHILTINEAFSDQLNALKGSFDHLGDVINNNMEKLKSDILEKINKKYSDFISLIESNIKSD